MLGHLNSLIPRYTVQVYTLQCILYTAHFTVYIVHCVHYTPCTIQSAVHTAYEDNNFKMMLQKMIQEYFEYTVRINVFYHSSNSSLLRNHSKCQRFVEQDTFCLILVE